MALLDAEKILAAMTRQKLSTVPVPEWGEPDSEVNVRGMTGAQRFQYERHIEKFPDLDLRSRLVAFTACDAEGKLIFSGDDVEALSTLDSIALDRVFNAAVSLNWLGPKHVDELEKNSEASPSDSSG